MPPISAFPTTRLVGFAVLVASVAVLGTLGCAEKSPEELLQEATQELAKATQTRDAAKASLDQLEKRLEDAQKARQTAFEAYEEARLRWEDANQAVGEFATDEVLHHQLNRALLDEPGLESSTIQARVNLRVATLVGNAGSQEAIDKAMKIAEGVPGVARVVSQIDLGPARRPDVATGAAREFETEEPPNTALEPDPEPEATPAEEAAEEVVEDEEPLAAGTGHESEASAAPDAGDLPALDLPEIEIPEGEWQPEADPLFEEQQRHKGETAIERQI